jgi:nitrate reductase molybdenum cofactor assembly chaperone NarJ/NarW
MTITFKALSALLTYPGDELLAALPEIRALLDGERRLPRAVRRALAGLADELAAMDALDAQERYVALFDRGRTTSLHLFEHVHGESRDRGQAMVDLKALYAQAGLALAGNELPDYLPALLEFLSLQPPAVAEEMLGDSAHILRKLGDALAARGSRYAAVLAAVLALAGERGLSAHPERAATEPEKPLDEEWAEEPVVFGPAARPDYGCAATPGGCGTATPRPAVVQFMPRPHAAP